MRLLSNGDYGVTIVEKKTDDVEKISSTCIRKLLQEGDMEEATVLLGRPFEINGLLSMVINVVVLLVSLLQMSRH